MNSISRWLLVSLLAVGTGASTAWTAQMGVVKATRLNVRGQPKLTSEVVTQVNQGEMVTVLEEIPVEKPKPGEPAKWLRIKLPSSTPVYVFAAYIDSETGKVNVNRLNLRAGPGENFSILGRIPRGTPVRELRVIKNWMEIEAPDDTSAFVAAEHLEIVPAPAITTEPAVTAEGPVTEPTPVTVQPVESDIVATAPETTEPGEAAAALPSGLETGVAGEPVPRIVAREGIVIISRSIQAPSDYALESAETHKTINYLHTESLGFSLKNFAGRKVIVTGEELLDKRWRKIPLLDVQTIQLVP